MEKKYAIGLAALDFFSLPGPEQVSLMRNYSRGALPCLFPEESADSVGADFFCCIGCIFITYLGFLYDKYVVSNQTPELADFHWLLNFCLQKDSKFWSEKNVLIDSRWEELRTVARNALAEIGATSSLRIVDFDLASLINPDEFLTSDAARRTLE